MRSASARSIALLSALAFGLQLLVGSPVMAAGAQVFPVQSGLVALVVAAAFILPAALAAAWSAMKRIGGSFGPVVGIALLAVVTAACVAYMEPGLMSALRI